MKGEIGMSKKMIDYNKIFMILMIALCTISIGWFLIDLFVNGTNTLINLIFNKGADPYMDFFNSIRDAKDLGVYEEQHVIYPALVNCLYYIIGKFIPRDLVYSNFNSRYEILDNSLALMTLIVYYAFLFVIVFLIIKSSIKNKTNRICFYLIVAFSFPFIYAIERGNIVILSAFFLVGYFGLRDNDKMMCRELSYVLFALSVSIKIYPIALIIIPLIEKRYKESIKMIIYSAILFVVPFIFFGGVTSIFTMLRNIFNFSSNSGGTAMFSLGVIDFLQKVLSLNFIDKKIFLLILAIVVIAIIFSKNELYLKTYACISFLYNIGGVSGTYAILFLFAPLLLLIMKKEKKLFDVIMLVFMIFPFLPIPLRINIHDIMYYVFYASIPVLGIVILITGVVKSLMDFISKVKGSGIFKLKTR